MCAVVPELGPTVCVLALKAPGATAPQSSDPVVFPGFATALPQLLVLLQLKIAAWRSVCEQKYCPLAYRQHSGTDMSSTLV